ncbi:MAG: homocysteine S-methyltransferase family protein, partial [Sulfuricurvum sp.]|nr:homocysteine S-methyltransferase family protein [Sulfuricurvum sp.]
MSLKQQLLETIKTRPLIIDGAMGTQLQERHSQIPEAAWEGMEGCNELLNVTCPEVMSSIFHAYLTAGADFITTNTFGAFRWVLEDYGIGERAYELSRAGAEVCKNECNKFSTAQHPRYVLGSIGPGTKLPSLGHIHYDEMLQGYTECALGLIDGGADVFLLETCQDPLQIKAALHACDAANRERSMALP